jgi:predicted RNA binding protein YcfA (HicA-like mRNA interferase family)
MKLPRDISGAQLVKALARVGYKVTRQTGSHIRLTCDAPSQHHVTVPDHDLLRLGTLAGVLGDVASHLRLTREELVERLFGKG